MVLLQPQSFQTLLVRLAAAMFAAALLLPSVFAAAAEGEPRTITAVANSLEWLARQQGADGSIFGNESRMATTAGALLGLLSSGQVQDLGRHGLIIRRASDFLLKNIPDDAMISKVDGTGMYGQAIVTIALVETYATEPDPQQRTRIKAAIERLTGVIIRSERVATNKDSAGGWSNDLTGKQSNLSTTVWCLLALRGGRNIGIRIHAAIFERGIGYVKQCAVSGGFADHPGGVAVPELSGAADVAIALLDPDPAAAVVLLTSLPAFPTDSAKPADLFFSTRASRYLSDASWTATWSRNRDHLLQHQLPDGSWPAALGLGKVGSTAMSTLTLTVPARLLTTFEK